MKKFHLTLVILGITLCGISQVTNTQNSTYQFTIDKKLDATEVKNQNKTGTCWSFSTSSFVESEMIRLGKAPVDLSMMWVVRNMYVEKAWNFLRREGKAQFAQGGEPHDVMQCIRKYGIVPKYAYSGENSLVNGLPNHEELDAILLSFMKTLIQQKNINPNWINAYEGILDAYLGKKPTSFNFQGKEYTPLSFAQYIGINPDDYVEITSFTHHPYYAPFILEIADNWDNGMAYNVPLDELNDIVNHALDNGFTIAWASDVSEKYFSFQNSIALVPKGIDTMSTAVLQRAFIEPTTEENIDQNMRQLAFNNLTTTDDHGMHIIGKAHDQQNHTFYLVKNSWGTQRNDMKGLFFCSNSYLRYKTTAIMIHKKAIPKHIAQKLGIVAK